MPALHAAPHAPTLPIAASPSDVDIDAAQRRQRLQQHRQRVRVIVIGICAVRRASVVTIQLHSLSTRTHADTPIAVNASADDGSLVDE